MIGAVADTHTAIWYLFNDPRLSAAARQFIERVVQDGNQVGVSSISIAEMVYLSEKKRIRETAVDDLIEALTDVENVLTEVPVTGVIGKLMRAVAREKVPDMPDRIIAATGLSLGVPVISRDAKIQASPLQTIW